MASAARHLISLSLITLLLAVIVRGSLTPNVSTEALGNRATKSSCGQIRTRREWRTLKPAQKLDFIRSIQCLQTRRARNSKHPNVVTLWDELQESHLKHAHDAHLVAQFLPWHRYFLHIYEKTLRESCQYHGPLPYWNQAIDADSSLPFSASPVFHPILGFGGDGVPGTYTVPEDPNPNDPDLTSFIIPEFYKGCVRTGPFASLKLNIGPGHLVTKHCLTRGIGESLRTRVGGAAVSALLSQPNFQAFMLEIDGPPQVINGRALPNLPAPEDIPLHQAGHLMVGGAMANYYTSNADPLFYLHHANVDRLWWLWQQANATRLNEISGPSDVRNFTNGPQITLDTPLKFGTLYQDVPVRYAMDTSSKKLCYTYV
ncbi:Di-copper centre-containing protein [Coprinopsis marcescibilis]|uniref:Di-copper centre-containing protein n=1 Tax=Coprinopsis marcescibilis TaxID=230819 RepID=A0A5C3L0P8_COPMA|nr:Di-copper centre-containing protein [Coprinopsis marcescibilis]